MSRIVEFIAWLKEDSFNAWTMLLMSLCAVMFLICIAFVVYLTIHPPGYEHTPFTCLTWENYHVGKSLVYRLCHEWR